MKKTFHEQSRDKKNTAASNRVESPAHLDRKRYLMDKKSDQLYFILVLGLFVKMNTIDHFGRRIGCIFEQTTVQPTKHLKLNENVKRIFISN